MKRKIRQEEQKEFKIFRSVFDRRTLLTLYQFLNKDVFKEVIGIVKEGKESVILVAKTKEGKYLAVKVYRTLACDFKTMWRYLVGDIRFLNVKKDRYFVVSLWCQREFKNLRLAYENGISCPKPIAFKGNVLVMEFIGEGDVPAPRLIDVKLNDYKKVYDIILDQIMKLAKTGIVHGDLSAYNILLLEKPYIIDLSHGTPVESQIAQELLERDIKNVNKFFEKKVEIRDSELILKQLSSIIEKR